MSDAAANAKRDAGFRAANMVEDGMIVGLGTGSTVFFAMVRESKPKASKLWAFQHPTRPQCVLKSTEFR